MTSEETTDNITRYAEPSALNAVAEFQNRFDCPIANSPCIAERARLRIDLLQEELDELRVAVEAGDVVETADALVDLQYVLSGAVLEFGMASRFKELFNEVHRSNMSKACASLDEAERTVNHYHDTKGFECEIRSSNAPNYSNGVTNGSNNTNTELDETPLPPTSYVVYRTQDGKVLKSIEYSAANLGPLVE